MLNKISKQSCVRIFVLYFWSDFLWTSLNGQIFLIFVISFQTEWTVSQLRGGGGGCNDWFEYCMKFSNTTIFSAENFPFDRTLLSMETNLMYTENQIFQKEKHTNNTKCYPQNILWRQNAELGKNFRMIWFHTLMQAVLMYLKQTKHRLQNKCMYQVYSRWLWFVSWKF